MKTSILTIFTFGIVLTACDFLQPGFVTMISPAELHETMNKNDVFLVDVHIPQQPHIRGTDKFVPYDQVKQHLDAFPQDKTTPIYLYCEGGPMANSAARTLHELGYTNLRNLAGGAVAWRKAGFEFE